MSEPIWCTVEVHLPPSWTHVDDDGYPHAPQFIDQLNEALINGDADYEDGVWTVNGEGNYGLGDDDVETVLEWMREHKVPFIAKQDAKYEMIGSLTIFDGTTEFTTECTESGAVITHDDFNMLIRKGGLDAVTRFWELAERKITDLSIDHLPSTCPSQEDEDE